MKRLMLAGLIFLHVVCSHAELYSNKISFQHVLENKDVVLGVTLSLHQDTDGFIWMGGESAVIRFDGYTFKSIGEINDDDPSAKPKSISVIPHIFEDSQGTLWIATLRGPLWYDKEIELFRRIPAHESLKKLPLSAVGARRIAELPDGDMAISTFSGVYIVSPTTGEGYLLRTSDGLSPGRVNTVATSPEGYLWIGTASGLDRYDPKAKSIQNFRPYTPDPSSESDNGVSSILFSQAGQMWLGTDRGLIRYEPDSSKFKRYSHVDGDAQSFSGGDIWWLSESTGGYLWIATDGGGLNMFDPKQEQFVNFRHESGRPNSLNSNVVRTVMEDNNGDIWTGNYPSGVNFFDKSSASINTYTPDASDPVSLSHTSVMDVELEPSGNIWVATDGGGLNYFDRSKQAFSYFRHEKDNPSTIGAPAVLSLFLDSQGVLWGGTWGGGAFTVDTKTHQIRRLPNDAKRATDQAMTHSKKLNNDKVWCIYEDVRGEIWFCTHEGGLSRHNRQTGDFTHYISTGEDGAISDNQVWTVFEDSEGVFWVGTVGGLNVFDRNKETFHTYLPELGNDKSLSNPSVLSIFEDSQKRLWFGTNEGLNLFNRETKTFTVFGKDHGFFDASIRSIIEDPSGNLWMGTNSGVVKFDPASKRVKNYNRESGKLIGGFNYTAAAMTEHAEAIMGGKKGLRIYKTQEMKDNEFLPPVVFTDLKINSETVVVSLNDGVLTKSINLAKELVLDHTQSIFEIDFAALGFRDTGKNQYAYMLQGFDSDWVEAGGERRAKYTNLDAGDYLLRVKASNNDGVWNHEEKQLLIKQLPPPWETWWAFTIYGLLILGMMANFVYKQRQKRRLVEKQNRLLEAKVAERTQELAKKNNDIQAMLSNMRQGLFTILPSGKVHPAYSAYLEKIFGTKMIAGCSAVDLLFYGADIGSDALNQTQEALNSIVGEAEMNFTFNAHVLPTDYTMLRNGKRHYLSLVWDPIVAEGIVEKIMVSVRDVTALREAEAEAQSQKRELDIISQVIKIPERKYLAFEEGAQKFIAENRAFVRKTCEKNHSVIDLLFRNMHTIKGNCRTYGLKYCNDVVHDVETRYSDMRKNTDAEWNQTALLEDLDRVESVIGEYHQVYHFVLGRGNNASSDEINVSATALQSIQRYISRALHSLPAANASTELQSANMLINISLSLPLSEVVDEVVGSLPGIARALKKSAPKVTFDDQNARIRMEAYETINNVFAHILRNSMDHGIESPDERVQQQKEPAGRISVRSHCDNDGLHITIGDDGRGVDLDALYQKGVQLKHWQDGDNINNEDIANLMFVSGASTKQEVSDISGRGVGMDAVKQFIEKIGGKVSLELLSNEVNANGFVPFQTVITLPKSHYFEIAYSEDVF